MVHAASGQCGPWCICVALWSGGLYVTAPIVSIRIHCSIERETSITHWSATWAGLTSISATTSRPRRASPMAGRRSRLNRLLRLARLSGGVSPSPSRSYSPVRNPMVSREYPQTPALGPNRHPAGGRPFVLNRVVTGTGRPRTAPSRAAAGSGHSNPFVQPPVVSTPDHAVNGRCECLTFGHAIYT